MYMIELDKEIFWFVALETATGSCCLSEWVVYKAAVLTWVHNKAIIKEGKGINC
jgi:hypothetical protein